MSGNNTSRRLRQSRCNKTEYLQAKQTSRYFWIFKKNIFTIRKPIYDFLSNFYWHFLSISYRFRDIRLQIFRVWLWPYFRNPLKVFRVWPWPLTFRGHLRSKIFHHLKAHIWLPIQIPLTLSLYLVPFSRYSTSKFLGFDLDLWPLGVTLRSKIFPPFESPYMTSYSTPIDTFSLSRTVFEIFDFKVFRVWPWPLTFRGHPRSNIFPPFESPYMTSYSTPIDTFSLSRTVFEIFDFKVFRVWPWPLTFRGHLRVKHIFTIWKPIYDFLFNSHWHFLSISYRFRDIRLQSF